MCHASTSLCISWQRICRDGNYKQNDQRTRYNRTHVAHTNWWIWCRSRAPSWNRKVKRNGNGKRVAMFSFGSSRPLERHIAWGIVSVCIVLTSYSYQIASLKILTVFSSVNCMEMSVTMMNGKFPPSNERIKAEHRLNICRERIILHSNGSHQLFRFAKTSNNEMGEHIASRAADTDSSVLNLWWL